MFSYLARTGDNRLLGFHSTHKPPNAIQLDAHDEPTEKELSAGAKSGPVDAHN